MRMAPTVLVLTCCVTGCYSAPAAKDYASVRAQAALAEESTLARQDPGSLFKSDTAVLSNDDIQKILAARVGVPDDAKLAVVRFGYRSPWLTWSEELARQDEQTLNEFLGRVRSAPRLRSVTVMPAMLVPAVMTIPYLRESAARVQADLMLVYRTNAQSFRKDRFLGKNETRAYCTVEAVLLDVRTGIITFTSIATENFSANESDRDMSFEETVARSEQRAIGRAMARVAADLVRFLSGEEGG